MDVEAQLKAIFATGSFEKIAFMGNSALLTFQQIVRKNSVMNITPIVEEYGMKVTRLETAFGTLVMKAHPLFMQMAGGFERRDGVPLDGLHSGHFGHGLCEGTYTSRTWNTRRISRKWVWTE